MEKIAHVDRNAALPTFNRKTLMRQARAEVPEVNKLAPAYGRKAVISDLEGKALSEIVEILPPEKPG